jgi:hypothetical protein
MGVTLKIARLANCNLLLKGRDMKLRLASVIAVTALACYAAAPISVQAKTKPPKTGALNVDCSHNTRGTLATIGAAITALEQTPASGDTINVSGACHENVVIQSLDRLTLNANPGASITDASGGTLEVIAVHDSRDVSINNFTINGGSIGISCLDGSLCRLTGNTVQNVATAGIEVLGSQAVVTGGTLQGNGFAGIDVRLGSGANLVGVTIVNNAAVGINVLGQSSVKTNGTIATNGSGIAVLENGYLFCAGCQVTGNGDIGVLLRRNSSARFLGSYAVTGNESGGILLTESSSAFFANVGTVTGNPGGMDVFCGSPSSTAKGATSSIGGGTTNCVEPSE